MPAPPGAGCGGRACPSRPAELPHGGGVGTAGNLAGPSIVSMQRRVSIPLRTAHDSVVSARDQGRVADKTVAHMVIGAHPDKVVKTFDRVRAYDSAQLLRERRMQLSSLAVPPGRGWEPAGIAMAECLHEHPTTIGGVIAKLERLQAILDDLPPSRANNRAAAFNALYLRITRRVDEALRTRAVSPEFLELLDVEFAKRYFIALHLWNCDDDATPDVWEVLFKRARDEEVSALVAAVLGVNAHINHDLSLALIDTWDALGAPEDDDDRPHADYLVVNEIFYEEIPPLRKGFSTDWQLALDGFVGPLDDWSQRVLVTVTRARAWEQARRLWVVRDDPDEFEAARLTMDRAASLLGEWLVVMDRFVNEAGDLTIGGWRMFRRMFPGPARRVAQRHRTMSPRTNAGAR
jgi:hypothetical protein